MKKAQKNPFRTSSKVLKKDFVTTIIKLKKEHILIIPNEVVKAFDLQIGDIAIFELSDGYIKIKFVKKTMFSFVEELDIEKLIKNKEAEFSLISGNIENEAIVFGKKRE
jgi:antitoxin component of MazEF toxin-antitoxin module